MEPPTLRSDPYIRYTHDFFRKWLPVYDAFALCIAPVYGLAVRALARRADATVLDIGAGTGEMAIRCARAGFAVTAIDVTPGMLARARRKAGELPIRFAVLDARALPYADGTYDCAVLSLTLHDMPVKVRVQVLREAARVTRERLVILEYDFPPALPLRRAWIWLVGLFESAYFGRFAAEGLEPALAVSGLSSLPRQRRGLPLFAVHTIDVRSRTAAGERR